MGYETKLIIGEEMTWDKRPDGSKLILEICRIDLSKCGYTSATAGVLGAASKSGEHFCFYADNGNDYVTEDCYGDKVTAVDIDALIAAMESDQKKGTYRRFSLALALLRQFRDDPEWQSDRVPLRILQWGH